MSPKKLGRNFRASQWIHRFITVQNSTDKFDLTLLRLERFRNIFSDLNEALSGSKTFSFLRNPW